MAKVVQFKRGEDFLFKLSQIELLTREEIIGGALYAGAAILTDSVRAELKKIPTDESWGTVEHPTNGPKAIQKEGIAQSLGIAKMQDDGNGFYNVKIGFDGYNRVTTKRWPQGQPNQMVARSVESGTTWMKKNPFVKRAAQRSRNQAKVAMKQHITQSIKKIMK